jgi:uncharacterized repeat protein (TIGR01451 family)
VNTPSHSTRTATGLAVLGLTPLALAAVLLLPVGTAVASPRTAPQLSIAVDDHHTSVTKGETLSYAITVKNLGGRRVTGLRVSQTVPTGLKLGSDGAHGVSGHGRVSWRVSLAPGATTTLHTTMKVQSTPQDLLRLASVACAGLTANRPIVCATHSDQLPAGAAAAAGASGTSGLSNDRTTWISGLAGLAGLVIVGGGAGVVLSRRRRTPRVATQPRH